MRRHEGTTYLKHLVKGEVVDVVAACLFRAHKVREVVRIVVLVHDVRDQVLLLCLRGLSILLRHFRC